MRPGSPTSEGPQSARKESTKNSDVNWGEVTPVNSGERESFVLSPSEILGLSPGRIFQHEESILIAQKGSERYRCELEREIERSNQLVSKISTLETSHRSLEQECSSIREKSATRERDLLKQIDAISEAKRSEEQKYTVMHSKLEEQCRELKETNRKVLDELELSKVREEGMKTELEDLLARRNTTMDESIKTMQSLCSSLCEDGGRDEDIRRQAEELSILNRNLAKENQSNAADIRASAQLKKEVEKLRGIQDEADRHRARSEKLQQVISLTKAKTLHTSAC
jgi:chromosome segregation ATPase